MNHRPGYLRIFFAILLCALMGAGLSAAPRGRSGRRSRARHSSRSYAGVPTYTNPAKGDVTEYDDPVVRAAAVAALGRYNGSVVAIDPSSGRVLSIVNQKLAFSSGFIPCSTIKPVIAIAALSEGVATRNTMIRVARHTYLNMVEAMAHSNNAFFAEMGRRLGFEAVSRYARLLGLGERAGYDIPEEHAGTLPSAPPAFGGVGRMSSFGQGIQMTPLELGALVSTLANGGTLYYLQYPRTPEAVENFKPKVKRVLDIASELPEVREGMLAAVLYGTARGSYISDDEQALGKTGTCSDASSRIGWFVSYADQTHPKIVLVILMRGHTRMVRGPMAAVVAGRIYRRLNEENFFTAAKTETPSPETDPGSTQ